MHRGEGARELRAEHERFVQPDALAPHALAERLALDPLHREEHAPVVELAVLAVTHDGTVAEALDRRGLALEPLPTFFGRRHDLQRDVLTARAVDRAIHLAHPAAPREADDREALGERLGERWLGATHGRSG